MKKKLLGFYKKIYFDGKIDLGIILTIIAIFIAWLSLRVSEKELETKVIEIQKLVEKLDEAELERLNLKIESIENSSNNINEQTEIWRYVTDNNRAITSIIEQRHFETSIINKEIIRIINSNKITNKEDKVLLNFLSQINNLTLEFNAFTENISNLRDQFEKENEPVENEVTNKEYIVLAQKYVEKLSKYNDSLNKIIDLKADSIYELKNKIWKEFIEKKTNDKSYNLLQKKN